jgi:glycosyltransferase involved in cell wall biosynthesis
VYKVHDEKLIANPIRNVVLWFPPFSRTHILKDPGQIPLNLSRIGYNVRILSYEDERNKDLNALDDVQLVKLRKHGGLLHFFDIPLMWYVFKNRTNIGCTILYFASLRTAGLSVVLKLLNAKSRYIVKMDSDGKLYHNRTHKPSMAQRMLSRIIDELAFRFLALSADLLIIESPEAKQRVLDIHPWLERKLVVLPNGINQRWFDEMSRSAQVDKGKTILFVGRVERTKGPDLLVRAFSRLKDKYPDWKVELVGEMIPTFRTEMEHLISRDLKHRIVLTGPLYGRDLVHKYQSASIFCFPSRGEGYSFIDVDYSKPQAKPIPWRESFGIALVEAMYCNCAIISSDVGAARYILDYGNAGIIFDTGSVDQLTACLDKLMGNEPLRNMLATAARSRCEKLFDWEVIISELDRHISNM